MRRLIYLILIAASITSCNNKANKEAENDSLAKTDRTVIYEVQLDIDPDFTNWMGNIDRRKLLVNIFDQVKNGELKAYEPLSEPGVTSLLWEEIESKFGGNDTIKVFNAESDEWELRVTESQVDLSEVLGIIFIEEWSLDNNNLLVKNILGIAPVRYYHTVFDDGETIEKKRILFVTYFGDKMPVLFEGY